MLFNFQPNEKSAYEADASYNDARYQLFHTLLEYKMQRTVYLSPCELLNGLLDLSNKFAISAQPYSLLKSFWLQTSNHLTLLGPQYSLFGM